MPNNNNYINNDYKFEEQLAISNIIKIKEPFDITYDEFNSFLIAENQYNIDKFSFSENSFNNLIIKDKDIFNKEEFKKINSEVFKLAKPFNLKYSTHEIDLKGNKNIEQLIIALNENKIKFSDNLHFHIEQGIIIEEVKKLNNCYLLEGQNLITFDKLKNNTNKGKYDNLELIKNTKEKHFSIKATEDISESTLLFEISGEVVSL